MSESLVQANVTAPSNEILQRLLDRLYNSRVSGPSLNYRPHTSRQRLDLTAFSRFGDLDPAATLRLYWAPANEPRSWPGHPSTGGL